MNSAKVYITYEAKCALKCNAKSFRCVQPKCLAKCRCLTYIMAITVTLMMETKKLKLIFMLSLVLFAVKVYLKLLD